MNSFWSKLRLSRHSHTTNRLRGCCVKIQKNKPSALMSACDFIVDPNNPRITWQYTHLLPLAEAEAEGGTLHELQIGAEVVFQKWTSCNC